MKDLTSFMLEQYQCRNYRGKALSRINFNCMAFALTIRVRVAVGRWKELVSRSQQLIGCS